MMTTLDSQLTPGTYQPPRFIFLAWVMAEPICQTLTGLVTAGMADGSALKARLIASTAHMRLLTMGLVLLVVLRFSPRGLIPER